MTLQVGVMLYVLLRFMKKESRHLENYCWSIWLEVKELRTARAITKIDNKKEQKSISLSWL